VDVLGILSNIGLIPRDNYEFDWQINKINIVLAK
jgi:hypothetical protein